MPVISVYVDDATMARLEKAAAETLRKVDDLASAAVEDAAVEYFRKRRYSDDPAPIERIIREDREQWR